MTSSLAPRFFRNLFNLQHVFTSNSRLFNVQPAVWSSKSAFLSIPEPHQGWRPRLQTAGLHTSSCRLLTKKSPQEALDGPRKWPAYNTIVLPPQTPMEPRRAAQCFHHRTQIRHSQLKLWYAAQMIRGLSIDDALNQLTFNSKKASSIIKEVLLEAQEIALKEHNFEFKSKMWIAESFSGRGVRVKGFRRHARGRYGKVEYNFNHYFVKLEEGDPPKNYFAPKKTPIKEQMLQHIEKLRSRRILHGL